MNKLKVSIVVPVYNVENYLEQCINSLLNQTYKNLEIIIVDDGSTDSSSFICDKFSNIDNRIIVIHKTNEGVSNARKCGLAKASGDYLLFVDSDDWLDLDTVQSCIDVILNNYNLGCVMFSYTKELDNYSKEVHVFDGDQFFLSKDTFHFGVYRRIFGLSNEELCNPERLENLTTCWMKMYRKDLADSGCFVDIKDIGSCEDGVFNMYALKECDSAVYIDKPFYHYRKLTNSLSTKYRPKLIAQWSNLFRMMQDYITESNLCDEFQESLNNRIVLSIIGIGLNEISNPKLKFISFHKYIKKYISSELYKESKKTIRLSKLPFSWKILIFSCKHRLSLLVVLILYVINHIIL